LIEETRERLWLFIGMQNTNLDTEELLLYNDMCIMLKLSKLFYLEE